MNIKVNANYEEMSRAVADFIVEYVRNNSGALLCFPSGDTPTVIFRFLVQDAKQGIVDFSNCFFIGLDEWVGLNGDDEGSCRHYMDEHLLMPLNIKADKIYFFDGAAANIEGECNRINEFIGQKGPLDLMMVGLGMNGHVGLNEPGVNFSLHAHISELQDNTKTVAKKYFQKEVPLSQGITLGPKDLLESKIAILIASGSKKASVVARALEGEINEDTPASIFQRHPNAYIFLDSEAAGLLSNQE